MAVSRMLSAGLDVDGSSNIKSDRTEVLVHVEIPKSKKNCLVSEKTILDRNGKNIGSVQVKFIPNKVKFVPNKVKFIPNKVEFVPNRVEFVPNKVKCVPNKVKYVPPEESTSDESPTCDSNDNESCSSFNETTDTIDIVIVNITDSGKQYTLKVKPVIMVEHLRNRIEKELDVPCCDQILKFGEYVLQDRCRMNNYGIQCGDKIKLRERLSRNEKFGIKIRNDVTRRVFKLSVSRTFKVRFLKKLISKSSADLMSEDDQVLSHGGIELDDDDCNLGDYDVTEYSCINIKYFDDE